MFTQFFPLLVASVAPALMQATWCDAGNWTCRVLVPLRLLI